MYVVQQFTFYFKQPRLVSCIVNFNMITVCDHHKSHYYKVQLVINLRPYMFVSIFGVRLSIACTKSLALVKVLLLLGRQNIW